MATNYKTQRAGFVRMRNALEELKRIEQLRHTGEQLRRTNEQLKQTKPLIIKEK